MRRGLTSAVLAGLLALTGCDQKSVGQDASAPPEVGVLALDLEPMAEPLADREELPTAIRVSVDGSLVAEVDLPAPVGLLDGHLAIPVEAGVDVLVGVEARLKSGEEVALVPFEVAVEGDEVARVPVHVAEDTLALGALERFVLPAGTHLSVTLSDQLREPLSLSELGDAPAAAIADQLADPQVASVTPFTVESSEVDSVGPLVAGRAPQAPQANERYEVRLAELEEKVEALKSRTFASPHRLNALPELLLPGLPEAPARAEPAVASDPAPTSADDFVYYFSYCDCGKPVPNRAYTLTTASGEVLAGTTDRFGLVLRPGLGEVAHIDFGQGARKRSRSYEYVAGDPETHTRMLDALGSDDLNDRLTAILDLRDEPLEAARPLLEQVMQADPSFFIRLNAAVTLSYYEGLRPLVERLVGGLAVSDAMRPLDEQLVILGGLRHPAALATLESYLEDSDQAVADAAAWAVDFVTR